MTALHEDRRISVHSLSSEREAAAPPVLTPTERQVLRLRALGLTSPAVAADLGITEQTVKNHLSSVYRKARGSWLVDALRAVGWLRVPVA